MNLRNLLLGGFVSISGTLIAQPHLGYHSDNYAGIHNITFQPADIVDSRYLVDINLVGIQLNAGNDYLALNSKALTNFNSFNDPNFQQKYVSENMNGRAKNVYLNSNLLLPSFMISIGKNSFAFQSNFHNIVNAEGISEKVAYASYRELKTPELWKIAYDNQNMAVQAMGWADFGLSYGREVYRKGDHYIKAAGTLKLVEGLYSAQLYSKNANVKFINSDTLDMNNTDFSYGHSSNFERTNTPLGTKFVGQPALAGDIGVVYEWRKKPETYTYSMDGRDDWEYNDRNKYKLKVGASVCNIGTVPFQRSSGSTSFYADRKGVPINDFSVKSIGQLDSTIAKYFVTKNDGGTTYQQSLPMTINLTADYNIWKGLYVNAAASVSPLKELDEAKTHDISHYSLTARYEFKWLSLWVPATYDALGNMHVGAGMRLGPFVVGINDFTPWITEKKMYDIGFYSMLRIPIFKDHKHDRDGDKISNRLDKCPKEPGLLANNGCPEPKPDTDKDGDGVMDKDDKCPDVKGLAELKGCPDGDKDKDGVLDLADKCPDVKGLEILKGCPDGDKDKDGVLDLADKCPDVKGIAALDGCPEPVDKDGDGDGILDKDDKCPAVAGIKELKGCPDTDKDGDGVVDRLDKCPDVKGLEILKGCPDGDKDKDGVLDLADKCPAVKGLPELDGCPDGDKDGDGVLDRKDKCPDVKGFADTEGCPHLEAEELEIINTAFNNLNFKRASDQITPDSYASLYRLATMLNKKTNYILEVNGHTDNTGNPAGNLALSVRRADAVKKYLMTKGIKDERITTHGYGDTRPLNENKTEEDRAKNRRVELLIKAR